MPEFIYSMHNVRKALGDKLEAEGGVAAPAAEATEEAAPAAEAAAEAPAAGEGETSTEETPAE